MGGREFNRAGVTYVVRVGITTVEEWDDVGEVWDDITGSALTASNTDAVSFATPLLSGSRILVFTNFIDPIQKYDTGGVCAPLGGTPPLAKFVQEYGPYLLLAYVDDGAVRPARVQWCDTGLPETWSGGSAGSKDLIEDGDSITGMALYDNYVAVHKSKAIYLGYLVTTSAVFKFDRKSTGAGTIANNSIQNLPSGEQAFLAIDGIRLFNGISAPLIESKVAEDLREGVNTTYISRVWSVVVKELNEYWLGVPIGSEETGSVVYKYNYVTRACHKDTRPNVVSAFTYIESNQPTWDDQTLTWDEATDRWDSGSLQALFPHVLLNDLSGLSIRRDVGVNSDNGAAVNSFWETRDFQSKEDPVFLCQWLEMELYAKGTSLNIEYSVDSGQTWTQASNSPLALSADFPRDDAPIRVWFDVVSSKIRFRFKNNELNGTFYLKQFFILYRNREKRGY